MAVPGRKNMKGKRKILSRTGWLVYLSVGIIMALTAMSIHASRGMLAGCVVIYVAAFPPYCFTDHQLTKRGL